MKYEQILYDVEDSIGTITLNRPNRLNAWTNVLEREVRGAMTAATGDPKVKVIILTGAGRLKGRTERPEKLQRRFPVLSRVVSSYPKLSATSTRTFLPFPSL